MALGDFSRPISSDSTRSAFRMSGLTPGARDFGAKGFLSSAKGGKGDDSDSFGKFLGAADMLFNRDRGYPQSRGFGGYGGSDFAGSAGFSQALGGTPGYSGSTFILPPGAGGYGGVGGYGGKRSTGQKLAAGAGGALSGALAGGAKGAGLGPHGAAIGAGLGFLSGFLG